MPHSTQILLRFVTFPPSQVEAVNALSPELSPAASAQVADLSAKMSVLEGQFKPPAVAFGSVCGDLRGKLAQCMADHKDDALACQVRANAISPTGNMWMYCHHPVTS